MAARSPSTMRGTPFIFVFPCKLIPLQRLQGRTPPERKFACGTGDMEPRSKTKATTATIPRISKTAAEIKINGIGDPPPVLAPGGVLPWLLATGTAVAVDVGVGTAPVVVGTAVVVPVA